MSFFFVWIFLEIFFDFFRAEKQRIEALKNTMNHKKLMFLDAVPICRTTSDMGIEDFKKEILDVIVDHSIYRDDQLEVLFHELKKKNLSIVGSIKLEALIEQIRNILDE